MFKNQKNAIQTTDKMYLIKNTFKYNSQLFKFYAYRVEAVVISITPRQRQKT